MGHVRPLRDKPLLDLYFELPKHVSALRLDAFIGSG